MSKHIVREKVFSWHRLSHRVALTVVMTLLALSLMSLPSQSASSISVSDYFTVNYQAQLNDTYIVPGQLFSATVSGTAVCNSSPPITVSSATITSRVVAQSQSSGTTVILNQSYVLNIDPFPDEVGESFQINQDVPLTFPLGSAYGTYNVNGELISATVQTVIGPLNVTSYLPPTQPMGTLNYEPDANDDGSTDMGDIITIERIILGFIPSLPAADANSDGIINIGDVTKVERFILGIDF